MELFSLSKRSIVEIDKMLHKRLKMIAVKKGVSMKSQMNKALESYLDLEEACDE